MCVDRMQRLRRRCVARAHVGCLTHARILRQMFLALTQTTGATLSYHHIQPHPRIITSGLLPQVVDESLCCGHCFRRVCTTDGSSQHTISLGSRKRGPIQLVIGGQAHSRVVLAQVSVGAQQGRRPGGAPLQTRVHRRQASSGQKAGRTYKCMYIRENVSQTLFLVAKLRDAKATNGKPGHGSLPS